MSDATKELRGDRPLRVLLLLYLGASLLHFSHNAAYLGNYPNLPPWISRFSIYLVWLGITAVGCLGYLLYRRRETFTGLAILGLYAGCGLGALLHYTRAPISAHSVVMNFTILFEAATAAALLTVVVITGTHRRRLERITPAQRLRQSPKAENV